MYGAKNLPRACRILGPRLKDFSSSLYIEFFTFFQHGYDVADPFRICRSRACVNIGTYKITHIHINAIYKILFLVRSRKKKKKIYFIIKN